MTKTTKQRVLVTGASGFVGRSIVQAMQQRGHQVFAASRSGQEVHGAQGVRMDIANANSVLTGVAACDPDAVVHLVGIIEEKGAQTFDRVHVEGTRHVLAATPRHARYLHMSALGADTTSKSNYSRTKGEAEQLVRTSGLAWTIFRPSLIFGIGDDFFGRVLKDLVSSAPVVPQIGDGGFLFRPISVEDVAQAFTLALEKQQTVGQSYDLTGPQEYTLRQLLQEELAALGQQKPLVPVPLPIMDMLVPMMQLLPSPPITADQYAMLKAGNTAPNEPAKSTFDLPMHQLTDRLPQIVQHQ